jgi:hypothetical protein
MVAVKATLTIGLLRSILPLTAYTKFGMSSGSQLIAANSPHPARRKVGEGTFYKSHQPAPRL